MSSYRSIFGNTSLVARFVAIDLSFGPAFARLSFEWRINPTVENVLAIERNEIERSKDDDNDDDKDDTRCTRVVI